MACFKALVLWSNVVVGTQKLVWSHVMGQTRLWSSTPKSPKNFGCPKNTPYSTSTFFEVRLQRCMLNIRHLEHGRRWQGGDGIYVLTAQTDCRTLQDDRTVRHSFTGVGRRRINGARSIASSGHRATQRTRHTKRGRRSCLSLFELSSWALVWLHAKSFYTGWNILHQP